MDAGATLWIMIGLVVSTMVIIYFLPRLTRAVPAPLIAILVISAIVIGFNINTLQVKDMASVAGGLPQFHIPMISLNWHTLSIIWPYSLILAAIGLLESLMTLSLVDEITETRGQSNRECLGQESQMSLLVFLERWGVVCHDRAEHDKCEFW